MCSAQAGCEQHSLSEQSVIPSVGVPGKRNENELLLYFFRIIFTSTVHERC